MAWRSWGATQPNRVNTKCLRENRESVFAGESAVGVLKLSEDLPGGCEHLSTLEGFEARVSKLQPATYLDNNNNALRSHAITRSLRRQGWLRYTCTANRAASLAHTRRLRSAGLVSAFCNDIYLLVLIPPASQYGWVVFEVIDGTTKCRTRSANTDGNGSSCKVRSTEL